jgi:hypothetical protein
MLNKLTDKKLLVVAVIILIILGLGGYGVYNHIHHQHISAQEIMTEDTPTTMQLDGLFTVTLPCKPTSYNKPSAILNDSFVISYQTVCGMDASNSSGDIYTVTSNRYLASGSGNVSQDLALCSPTIDPITFKTEDVNGATFNECVAQANSGAWYVWAIAAQPNSNSDAIIQILPPGGVTKVNNDAAWGALESVVESLQFSK